MKLLFRADASEQIGTGHIMRCLTLARRWCEQGQEALFAVVDCSPGLERRIRDAGIGLEWLDGLPGGEDDAISMRDLCRRAGVGAVVVDGYSFSPRWHRLVAESGLPTLLINDDPRVGLFPASLLVNQNVYATSATYSSIEASTRLLLGPQFALLRPEFLQRSADVPAIASDIRNVLVTMGGSDPKRLSEIVLNALGATPVAIRIIAGGGNARVGHLETLARARGGDTHILVDSEDMAAQMAWADLAISAAGSTALELACMGVPSLYVATADNQRAVAEAMAAYGAGINLGWYEAIDGEKIADAMRELRSPDRRALMRERGHALVDGRGIDRVLYTLRKLLVSIRLACDGDRRAVWEWVNDPLVRAMSFSSAPITWADHTRWWAKRVTAGNEGFYIGQFGSEDIGYVRFDEGEASRATVSLALAPSARGKHLGSALLEAGCCRASQSGFACRFEAYIRPDNRASLSCFEAAGFTYAANVLVKGMPALMYTRDPR